MSDTSTAIAEDVGDTPTTTQKLAAEAIGTFVLVFFGVGSAIASGLATGGGDYTGIALAFGLTVVAGAYAFGRVSGAHFNPAVSAGVALSGRLSWKEAGTYMAAQVVGALVAGLLLALIQLAGDTGWEFGDAGLGENFYGDQGGIELFGVLLVEIIATFVFLLIILAVTDKRGKPTAVMAPLVIGLTLTMIHLATIGFDGTSVNPARSLGVAFFAGGDAIAQVWVFVVAPLIGGLLAGLAYPALFGRDGEPVAGSGLNFGGAAAGAAAGGYQPNWHGDQGQQGHYDQWGQQGQWGQQEQWAAQQQGQWVQDEHGQWVAADQYHQQQGQQQGQHAQQADHGQWQQQGDWQQAGSGQQWDQGAQQAAQGSGDWGQQQWQQPSSPDAGGADGSGSAGPSDPSTDDGADPLGDPGPTSDSGQDGGSGADDASGEQRPPWTPPADGGGTQIRPQSDQ